MKLLLCDGPLNGEYLDVEECFCAQCPATCPPQDYELDGHDLYFRVGADVYAVARWPTGEIVGQWVMTEEPQRFTSMLCLACLDGPCANHIDQGPWIPTEEDLV